MGGWRRRLGLQGSPDPDPDLPVDPAGVPSPRPDGSAGPAGSPEWDEEFEFVPQFDIREKPATRNGPRASHAPATRDSDRLLESVAYIDDASSVPPDSEPPETGGTPPQATGSTPLTPVPPVEPGWVEAVGHPEPPVGQVPADDLPNWREMSNVETSLKEAAAIDGAIAVALVDYTSGMSLGSAGDTSVLNLDVAAAGNTDVVRAKLRTLEALGLTESIEDILITLSSQYHLIRLIKGASGEGLFLYLVLDKTRANLAMARHKLSVVERNIQV